MVVTRKNIMPFHQERLAKDDIRLLLQGLELAKEEMLNMDVASHTRIELLVSKLYRMEKQK